MTSTYYNSIASSLTTEDQNRIIAELSNDGTLAGIDIHLLQQMIANNDTSVANVDDLAYIYTYLTGTFPTAWDAELVDPDLVDELEEWANLSTSPDLKADILEFVNLISIDSNLSTALSGSSGYSAGLSTDLGGSMTMQANLADVVNYANEYYSSTHAAQVVAEKDYKGLINLAFSMGSPTLALLYIMKGYEDPVTGEDSEGLMSTIADSQEKLVDHVGEINDSIVDLMDERETLDAGEDSERLANISAQENMLQQDQNITMQSFTSLQSIISDTINALVKIAEMDNATKQRIWN